MYVMYVLVYVSCMYSNNLLNGVDDCTLDVDIKASDVLNELFSLIALHGTSEHQQQDPLQLRVTCFCIKHVTFMIHLLAPNIHEYELTMAEK